MLKLIEKKIHFVIPILSDEQGEHSAILSTFIKLQVVQKIFFVFIFEWQFYTGFIVCYKYQNFISRLI